VALHGAALLADPWLHPGLAGVTVPLASPYRPFWIALGVVGGYGLAALGLSYWARARIGAARWRRLHRFTALFWGLGVVHALGAGTDASRGWFLAALALATGPALVLLARHGLGRRVATLH
jgi:methionine sulfoxide reductase heme-binding subunit